MKGTRELRALGASQLRVVRRVSERGLTPTGKMRGGGKEVTMYGESHFEGRKEGGKEITKR